jgi:hypothetical protein
VDHENRIRSDNSWANLRDATRQQNNTNVGLRKDSTTGVKGVYPRKNGTFRSSIQVNGKRTYLGTFDTLDEATAVRLAAVKKCHGEFAYIAANDNNSATQSRVA